MINTMTVIFKTTLGFLGAMWEVIEETFKLFQDKGLIFMGAIMSLVFTVTGGESEIVKALIICMSCDYITGIIKAVKQKNINFYIGFFGIFKKVVIIIIIIVVNELDVVLGLTGSTISCKFAITCFYISNEIVSILENAGAIGIQVPKQLMKLLEHLQNLEIKNK